MKIKPLFILAGILFVAALCFLCYFLGFNKGKAKAVMANMEFVNDVVGMVDYPLIEISFYPNPENEWVIINRVGISAIESMFYVIQDDALLQWGTDKIKVITFQQGRGTAPNGIFYVYKNKELKKEVPYWEIHIDDEEIIKAFRQITVEELEALIGQKLPLPI